MSRWKLFSKSKRRDDDRPEPQEEIKKEETSEPQIEKSEEQNIEEEEKILAEYTETLYTGSKSTIKGKTQALTEAAGKIAEKAYAEQAAGAEAGAQQAEGSAAGGDDVVDAEFEEVKENKDDK